MQTSGRVISTLISVLAASGTHVARADDGRLKGTLLSASGSPLGGSVLRLCSAIPPSADAAKSFVPNQRVTLFKDGAPSGILWIDERRQGLILGSTGMTASVSADGSFSFYKVPEGDYALALEGGRLCEQAVQVGDRPRVVRVTNGESVDLGSVQLRTKADSD